MIKRKLFLSFDKEEKWLENMSEKGWKLIKAGYFSYYFKAAEPESINLKIDYRTFSKEKDFVDYCLLFEDSGWAHVAGTMISGNQYFVALNPNSNEDIFSDTSSRAGRYKRVFYTIFPTTIFLYFSVYFIMSYYNGTSGIDKLMSPKDWYLTPGLWDMTGVRFWWSFLFETPFALMRGLGGLILLLIAFFYLFLTIKFWREHKKALKNDELIS